MTQFPCNRPTVWSTGALPSTRSRPARVKNFRLSLLLLVLSVVSSSAMAAAAPVRLPQADGSTLELEQPARSIVTLSPHLTELVFAAGLGDRIVATVDYSDFPEEAARLPRVGDAFRLDLERILALKPDLVIAWHSGNPRQAVARLQTLGLTTWSIEILSPEDIADVLQWIGLAGGQASMAREAADRVRQALEQLSARYHGSEPVSYFYQVAAKPLFTVNGDHLISQGLARCGGMNIFSTQPVLAPQVGHEAVIAANPRVLFAPTLPGASDPLATWSEWPDMRAVRSGALYLLPADEISRASPRLMGALNQACSALDEVRKKDATR